MVRLWALTLLDFLRSVLEQHLQKETHMSKSQLIKFSGWAFILGSFTFLAFLANSNEPASLAESVIGSILLAIGMLGLRARYGDRAGGFGSTVLLAGVIGMVVLYVLLASLALMVSSGFLSVDQILPSDRAWILLFGGPAILLPALTLFGLSGLRGKPSAGRAWLPALAGIWYPLLYFFVFGYIFARNGVYPAQYQTGFDDLLFVQFLSLCIFGAVLAADTPQEMTA
jgi:hypothetical protein